MSRMKRPTPSRLWSCVAAVAATLLLCPLPDALAQGDPLPAGVSRGENFSAGKSPAQLFASDCTGAGCHKGPQGLGKGGGIGLAGFLREHYTNSRESAAALANYLSKIPSGPEPREARTPSRQGKPAAAAASGGPSWGEVLGLPSGEKQKPHATPREREHQGGRASRAAARHDEDPAPPPAAQQPATQRGRQPATAAVTPPQPSPPEPEAAPAPPPPPKQPAPKQYDIFD